MVGVVFVLLRLAFWEGSIDRGFLLPIRFEKKACFKKTPADPSDVFSNSVKGSPAFSPSHPLLPLRQKQQKTVQGEDASGNCPIPLLVIHVGATFEMEGDRELVSEGLIMAAAVLILP